MSEASEESSTSSVSQERRRARPVSGSDGNASLPAARRRRVDAGQQRQWSLYSTVKTVLMAGEVRTSGIKLNYFLCKNFGGEAVIDEDHNVMIEFFFSSPMRTLKTGSFSVEFSTQKNTRLTHCFKIVTSCMTSASSISAIGRTVARELRQILGLTPGGS
ncbi:retrotransposon hot spot (RHS) protein [Trypanosoma conorhini]|uniref:Retrotransposon hot spot (RHS) protein n=1 Tax=Trypanosoma conorhini TaxID=83891 RepID=A0A3R7LFW7_9TRYP|nr:retrotransposon hot spot (RHS) protein [Trypanosoma conorhini]RNF27620.1 retrotransposon hot spot (RHS) protein [Trypanosoma conorhini]